MENEQRISRVLSQAGLNTVQIMDVLTQVRARNAQRAREREYQLTQKLRVKVLGDWLTSSRSSEREVDDEQTL